MPFTADAPSSAARMVGRDDELARLQAAFARASAGEPSAVVVAGEAGIGKSRLLREFAASVAGQADIATSRCLDLGGTPVAYGAILGLLRDLVAQRGADRVMQAAGPGRAALQLLMPELGDSPEATRPDTSPERLREAFVTAVESLADTRPLVLMIEDLHWADGGTLTLLSFLLRVVTRGRLLVVLAWRSDESGRNDPVRLVLGEAERAHLIERITLERLDAASVHALVSALATIDDEDILHGLAQRAEGIPFFVEELSRCATATLPDTLRDLLLARYEQLSEDAAAVVRVAAASDSPLEHETLTALSGLDGPRLNDGIREAMRTGILVVDEDRYTFRHALLREAVHDELLPGERAALHRAFAEHLQGLADADPRRDLHAALAHHWQLAHDRRRALVAATAAMWSAKARYAFSTAARFGRLVLELWDQVDDAEDAAGIDRITLMLRIGSILRNAGDSERALTVVDGALTEAGTTEIDPALQVRLLRDKAMYLVNLGRPGAAELLAEALDIMDGRVHDDKLSAIVLCQYAGRQMVAGHIADAIDAASRAWDCAVRAGVEEQMSVARNLRGTSRAHRGDLDGAFADYAAAREHARTPAALLRYQVNYSDMLAMLGRYREAVTVAEEGSAQARGMGIERTSGSLMIQNTVEALLELGEIDRVDALLARDLELRTFPVFRMYTTTSRVRALAWHGGHARAAALLREQRAALDAAAMSERQVWYYALQARLAIAQAADDPRAALEVVHEMLDDTAPQTAHRVRILLEAGAIIAALRARSDEVPDTVERVRAAWSDIPEMLRPAAWTQILDALLAPTADTLEAAVACADGDDVPATFRVVVRLEQARALVAAGRRTDAAAAVAAASQHADDLQHEPLRREVAAFAAASGLAPAATDADASTALGELTPRERQVLDLIAEGLSNGQIAKRLFISVKTASVHVSAILRKLGVTSRTEAAVLAAPWSRAPRDGSPTPPGSPPAAGPPRAPAEDGSRVRPSHATAGGSS